MHRPGAEETANILIVDDVPANLTALEAILAPLGQRIVKAAGGRAALKALLQQDFACILLDVQMPDLDGFETARLVKSRARSRHVPILFITAFSRDEMNIDRGYAEGAVDYIVKPFNPDILRTKVAVFVDLFLQSRRMRSHESLMRDREREVMEREARERTGASRRDGAGELDHGSPAEAILACAPVPIALVHADGRIVSLNEAFAELLQSNAAALRRHRLGDVGAAMFEHGVREALHSGEPVKDMLVHPMRDGGARRLEVTFKRVQVDERHPGVALFVTVAEAVPAHIARATAMQHPRVH